MNKEIENYENIVRELKKNVESRVKQNDSLEKKIKAATELNDESLQKHLEELKDEISDICDICNEPYLPPVRIYQCIEGHILCEECSEKLKHCPFCQKEYPNPRIRNRAMEKKIEEQYAPTM